MRKFIFILIWLVSVIIASIYTYENPEVIESIRHNFEKHLPSKVKFEQGPYNVSIGNSFVVEFSQTKGRFSYVTRLLRKKSIP